MIRDTLINVRALIADPKHWTQDVAARDNQGNQVDENSDDAYSFCLVGALSRITNGNDSAFRKTCLLLRERLGRYLTKFNDNHTHQEVLDALDRAINASH